MCGGRGTRLATDREKPLFPVAGVPMVERVRAALAGSRLDRVYAVTSPHAPATAADLDLPRIGTPGEGYVADLDRALEDGRVSPPVVTVAADLPLLEAAALDRVLAASGGASLTVAVPVGRKRALGLSVDTAFRRGGRRLTPAGVNVVGGGDDHLLVARDPGLAANVNRRSDAARVEWLLAGDRR